MLSALDPTRKAAGEGGGVLPASGPIRKAGGGEGAVHLRPDTKSGGGEGVLSGASGPIQKAEKGEGLFSRRGGVTIYERGGCNPQTPPGSASAPSIMTYRGDQPLLT